MQDPYFLFFRRQQYGKDTAFARCAFHIDEAAQGCDQLLYNGQAQAGRVVMQGQEVVAIRHGAKRDGEWIHRKGRPVAGATVYGQFSGSVSGSPSATTNASGVAVLQSAIQKKPKTATFCVTDVSAALPYAPGDNVETCADA